MDRLSCLPDDVISHILGFLPTKRSMQTSVLSKRWRFHWAHVPFLELNFEETDSSVDSGVINKILLQHKHDIHTFHLHGYLFEGSEEEFESCIVNIITCNIRDLVIDILDYPFQLPQCLFTCKTLVEFYLTFFGDRDIPMSGVYFPALKKLTLGCPLYVSVTSHESLARLLSGCPVLEELSFSGLVSGQFCVSSSVLTRLELLLNNDKSKFVLKLDTPALRYLQLHCCMYCEFSVGALDSLIEADIDIFWDMRHPDNLLYSRNVLKLVSKLHNVEHLRLVTGPVMTTHGSAFAALGINFHNLTNLELNCNLAVVAMFLEKADNLRVLKLMMENTDLINKQYYWMEEGYIDNQYCWMEPKRVPACLSSHLQTVKMRYFGCYEEEFDMARYILMNAKVLKKMKIITALFDLKKEFEALKRLASFGRGSPECELVFD